MSFLVRLIILTGFFLPGLTLSNLVNLIDTAKNQGNFNYLVKAMLDSNLVLYFAGGGPFTVFGPTDQAFDKLPPSTIEYLFRSENLRLLQIFLLYHVLPQSLTAADIVALKPPVELVSFTGKNLSITLDQSELRVNNITIIKPDILASNGVIHAIDSVLIAPKEDLYDTAIHDGNFDILAEAIRVAGLMDTFKNQGPFTIFGPTNFAFGRLPAGTLANLLKPENRQKLIDLLNYHVVEGYVTAATIANLNPPIRIKTLGKQTIVITRQGKDLKINNATVVFQDFAATNGFIHGIDQVLIPSE